MFETKRLMLVNFKDIEPEDIFKYGSDPEVSKYIGWPLFKTVEDAKSTYNTILTNMEKGTHYYFAMIDKDTGEHVGSVMIFGVANGMGEVGYVLDRDHWGKGYGTEGVKWMVEYGLSTLDLRRMVAHVVEVNIGSARILEKLGFTKEGFLREHYNVEGEYLNGICFGLLKREYKNK